MGVWLSKHVPSCENVKLFYSDELLISFPLSWLSDMCTSELQLGWPPIYMFEAASDILWGINLHLVTESAFQINLFSWHDTKCKAYFWYLLGWDGVTTDQLLFGQRLLICIKFDSYHLGVNYILQKFVILFKYIYLLNDKFDKMRSTWHLSF